MMSSPQHNAQQRWVVLECVYGLHHSRLLAPVHDLTCNALDELAMQGVLPF